MSHHLYRTALWALLYLTCTHADIQLNLEPKIGVNSSRFYGKDDTTGIYSNGVSDHDRAGLIGGVGLELAITPVISIVPEILFSSVGERYNYNNDAGSPQSYWKIQYLNIPLLLRATTLGEKFCISFNLGPKLGILLNSEITSDTAPDIDITKEIAPFEFGITSGFGLKFGTKHGDILCEGSYSLGLTSIDNSTNQYDIKNTYFSILLGYAIPLSKNIDHTEQTNLATFEGHTSDSRIGFEVKIGALYDNVRFSPITPPEITGGPIADIAFVFSKESYNFPLGVKIPLLQPLLLGILYQTLQFEPELFVRIPMGTTQDWKFVPAIGVSFYYGPEEDAPTNNHSTDFFGAGPLGSMSFLYIMNKGNHEQSIALRPFMSCLFGQKYHAGFAIGGTINYQVLF